MKFESMREILYTRAEKSIVQQETRNASQRLTPNTNMNDLSKECIVLRICLWFGEVVSR